MSGIDFSQKKKIGFVCSGGAVKAAAFHVGVAMALENIGFQFLGREQEGSGGPFNVNASRTVQTYVGSSAGALVAVYLAQGGKLKDLQASFAKGSSTDAIPGLKYWEMLSPRVKSASDLLGFDKLLSGLFRSKSIPSPFSTEGVAKYLKSHVIHSDRFDELASELFIVGTELNRPTKTVFGKYKSVPEEQHVEYRNDVLISDASAASMSLPPLYHPYQIEIEGKKRYYYDGEIREPLSSHIARDVGCDLIICSYTHQPLRLPADSDEIAKGGVYSISLQAIYQVIEQKIQHARGTRHRERALVDDVRGFFKEKKLPADLCDELIARLERRLNYRRDVDYIYIFPRPSDQEMFLLPHFSLDRAKTEKIVRKGYLAAMTALKGIRL